MPILYYWPFETFYLPKDERKFESCSHSVHHPSEHSTLTREFQDTMKALKQQREQSNQHEQGALCV